MILVTGASGFVGRAILAKFCDTNMPVRGTSRATFLASESPSPLINVGNIDVRTIWDAALESVDVVVHTAARVHIMRDTATDIGAAYRATNVEGTLHLARQAAASGVRRFIFLSSVKVNGEFTEPEHSFKPDDIAGPQDAYGASKWEAEQGLQQIAMSTGIEVVIIRPPLVYGPGVRANFATMMRWLAYGVPLPLGGVTHNRRSLVALDNLVNLITVCVDHPAAANQTFFVSDGVDVSTTQLLRRMGQAMGRPARLLPVPQRAIELTAALLGKQDIVQRLLGSLQVDISKTQQLLGWAPPVSLDEGLRRAAANVATRW